MLLWCTRVKLRGEDANERKGHNFKVFPLDVKMTHF